PARGGLAAGGADSPPVAQGSRVQGCSAPEFPPLGPMEPGNPDRLGPRLYGSGRLFRLLSIRLRALAAPFHHRQTFGNRRGVPGGDAFLDPACFLQRAQFRRRDADRGGKPAGYWRRNRGIYPGKEARNSWRKGRDTLGPSRLARGLLPVFHLHAIELYPFQLVLPARAAVP